MCSLLRGAGLADARREGTFRSVTTYYSPGVSRGQPVKFIGMTTPTGSLKPAAGTYLRAHEAEGFVVRPFAPGLGGTGLRWVVHGNAELTLRCGVSVCCVPDCVSL